MQFIKFSQTGLMVSRLCLGTGTFGKQTDESESFRVFEKAADAGVNFIDTADVYPGGADLPEVGRAEEITGRWLKGKRGRFILGTKAGGRIGSSPWDQGSSCKHLLDAIEASLRRLNTDYVDLYQLHMDDAATPLDETVEALDAIVRSGKTRYIGVSNFLAYRLAPAIGRQDTLRLTRFVSAQPRYNLLFREIERELLPLAQEENLAVIPYNPLAGGLLSGKYQLDEKPEKGRFSAEVRTVRNRISGSLLASARVWDGRQAARDRRRERRGAAETGDRLDSGEPGDHVCHPRCEPNRATDRYTRRCRLQPGTGAEGEAGRSFR
jgi:aryl-alcohol dehydrogenase-like predicted oxidoreductase